MNRYSPKRLSDPVEDLLDRALADTLTPPTLSPDFEARLHAAIAGQERRRSPLMSDGTFSVSLPRDGSEARDTSKVPSSAPPTVALLSLQRTYCALFDDTVTRHSKGPVGEQLFNSVIAKNLLFGGGIYLHDSCIVNHPAARRGLRDDNSLLRVMLNTNFIRLLTKTTSPQELVNMPNDMANIGTESFRQLVTQREWHDMFPLYAEIAHSLYHINNVRRWPRFDMSEGFCTLIDRIFENSTPNTLGLDGATVRHLQDLFYEQQPRVGNARDKFEKAAQEVARRARRRHLADKLMDIANQAYHYNFGLTLAAEEVSGVAVDTTISSVFDELLMTRSVSYDQIEGIPLIQLPRWLPLDDGDLFRPFLDPASAIARAKRDYLAALRNLLSAPAESAGAAISNLRKDIRSATDVYLDTIGKLFKTKIGRAARELARGGSIITMEAGRLDTVGRSGDAARTTSALPAGLALTLRAKATAQSRQFLIERFKLIDEEKEPLGDGRRLIRLGEICPQIESASFDPEEVHAFLAKLHNRPQRETRST